MSFQAFGIRSFVPDTGVREFVGHLAEGRVMASHCRDCGRTAFPPRSCCPGCGSEAFDWTEIDGTGRLLTYTRVSYGPAGFEDKVPYTLAVAEFPMGVRVFGQVAAEVDANDIAVGMPVRVVAHPLGGGRVSFHFVRADGLSAGAA